MTNIQHFSVLHKFPNIKINQGKEKLALLYLAPSDRQGSTVNEKQQENAFFSDAQAAGKKQYYLYAAMMSDEQEEKIEDKQ